MFLLLLVSLLFSEAKAAEITESTPMGILCIERVVQFSKLIELDENDAALQSLRSGVEMWRKVERAGLKADQALWNEAIPFIESNPIFAIEADAITADLMLKSPQGSPNFRFYAAVRLKAKTVIGETLLNHHRSHFAPTTSPVTDPDLIAKIGEEILKLRDFTDTNTEVEVTARIARLGEAEGMPALAKAMLWLWLIKAANENPTVRGAEPLKRICALTDAMLVRVFIRAMKEQQNGVYDGSDLFRTFGGGNAGQFLFDLEAYRAGRSPLTILMNSSMRMEEPNVTNAQTLADARVQEMAQGLYDGKPFYDPKIRTQLLTGLLANPVRLPSGEKLPREIGPMQSVLLLLVESLLCEDRTDDPAAIRALGNVMKLIGDPRIDQKSVFEWMQSLLGDRRSFSPVQFLRFLQEANTILREVERLDLTRKAIIAREHRKLRDEELGPSFDLWIVDAKTMEVVEAVEIKQTETPRKGSDIGGILKQATSKLDAELVISKEDGAMVPRFHSDDKRTIRHLVARKKLVIQIDWNPDGFTYNVGSLKFVVHASGNVEKWGGPPGQEKLLGTESLFRQIADHLPKASDTEIFDEIELVDYDGLPVVRYFTKTPKRWDFNL